MYISEKEFLSKSKEIQNSFIEWWKPDKFQIVYSVHDDSRDIITEVENGVMEVYSHYSTYNKDYFKKSYIPLLTETMLREFIENKTGGLIHVETSMGYADRHYTLKIKLSNSSYWAVDDVVATDLLEAYWKAACMIAEAYTK